MPKRLAAFLFSLRSLARPYDATALSYQCANMKLWWVAPRIVREIYHSGRARRKGLRARISFSNGQFLKEGFFGLVFWEDSDRAIVEKLNLHLGRQIEKWLDITIRRKIKRDVRWSAQF